MHREKSITRHTDRITTSFSSSASNDHESLGADQEQAPKTHASTHNVSSSSVMLPRQGGSLHNMTRLLESTRLSGRTIFQCNFVFPSHRHVNNF